MTGDDNTDDTKNDDTNSLHNWLLIDWQVSKFCKAFANNSSANVKL